MTVYKKPNYSIQFGVRRNAKLKPASKYLLEMLSNNDVTFFIPPYQRNYEWDTEPCSIFWEDIIKAADSNLSNNTVEHFFGTFTYFEGEHLFGQPAKLVLIDGQQRITTTMLFLMALRDVVDNTLTANYINNHYLTNPNSVGEDDELKIKLKQVETDWAVYCDIILKREVSERNKLSSVFQNYSFFKNKLLQVKKQNRYKNLSDLITYGLSKFSVVAIQLEPATNKWEKPQEIFESMNSLGKPLSLADLVRNYLLLGKSPSEQDRYYKNYWMKMETELPENVSNFIRDYMQLVKMSPYKKATEKNYKPLYAEFKKLFANEDTEELLEKLSVCSGYYSYIVKETPSENETLNQLFKDFRIINVTTANSFILGLIQSWKEGEFSDSDLINCLNAFLVYVIRRRILGITNGENKSFPTLVKHIPRLGSSDDKWHEMFKILAEQEYALSVPNDNEILNEMTQMNFYNFSYCRLLLSLMEEKITGNRPEPETTQVEHIMPLEDLSEEWKAELGDDAEEIHTELVNNIGNLTLIRSNNELGQTCFSQKKDFYQDSSDLELSKLHITSADKWDAEAIRSRRDWMINFILTKVLPIPDEMRRGNNFNSKGHSSLSFKDLGLIGENINYIKDKSIVARVVGDKEVEFEGVRYRLSPLTREIEKRKGTLNPSGDYSGARWWEYEGMKLSDLR